MPIKTQYSIYDSQRKAPMLQTFDKTTAYVEWQNCLRQNGELYRLEQTPIPDGALTKAEEYLMLVYRIRKLWRCYFDCGRKHEDLLASVEQEQRLDKWNFQTMAYLRCHPGYANKMNDEAYGFYVVVSEWRNAWKERKKYSKDPNCDKQILDEISKKCRKFEKEVDKYIKNKLNLL